jgi:hypothetical protein
MAKSEPYHLFNPRPITQNIAALGSPGGQGGSAALKSIQKVWRKVSALKNPFNSTFCHGFQGLHI